MASVGIRLLKQNASEAVARAAAGERLTVTDRGRPVALLTPIPTRRLDMLMQSGQARPPRTPGGPSALAQPTPNAGRSLAAEAVRAREDERF